MRPSDSSTSSSSSSASSSSSSSSSDEESTTTPKRRVMSRPVSAGRPAPVIGSRPPSGAAHPPPRQATPPSSDDDEGAQRTRDAAVTRALEAKEERIRQAELSARKEAAESSSTSSSTDQNAGEREALAAAAAERSRVEVEERDRQAAAEVQRERQEAEERERQAASDEGEREAAEERVRQAAEAEREREAAAAAAEAAERELDAARAAAEREREETENRERQAVAAERERNAAEERDRQAAAEAAEREEAQERERQAAVAAAAVAEEREIEAAAEREREAAEERERQAAAESAEAERDRQAASAQPSASSHNVSRRSPSPDNYSDDEFEASSPKKDIEDIAPASSTDNIRIPADSENSGISAEHHPQPSENVEGQGEEGRHNETVVADRASPPRSLSASRDRSPARSASSRSRRSSSSSSSSSYEPLSESQNSAKKAPQPVVPENITATPVSTSASDPDAGGPSTTTKQQIEQSKPTSATTAQPSALSTPPRKRSSASAGEPTSTTGGGAVATTTDTPRHVAPTDTVQSLFSARSNTSSRVKSGASSNHHHHSHNGASMTDSGERRIVGDVRRWLSPYGAPMVGHTRLILKDVCDLEEQRKKEVEVYRQKVKYRDDEEKHKKDDADAKAAERKKISTPSPRLCKPRHQKPKVGPYAPIPPPASTTTTSGHTATPSQERARRRSTVDNISETSGSVPHYMHPLPPRKEPRPILFRPQTQQFKLHNADDEDDAGGDGGDPVALTSEEFAARFYQAQVEAHDAALNKTFLKLTGAPKPPPPPLRDLSNLLRKDGPPRAVVKDDEEEEEIDEEEEKRLEFAREMGRKHCDDALANQQRSRDALMTKYLGAEYVATAHRSNRSNRMSVAAGADSGSGVGAEEIETRDLRTEPLSPSEKRYVNKMYTVPVEHQKTTMSQLWNRMEAKTVSESLHRDTVMSPEKWTAAVGRLTTASK